VVLIEGDLPIGEVHERIANAVAVALSSARTSNDLSGKST